MVAILGFALRLRILVRVLLGALNKLFSFLLFVSGVLVMCYVFGACLVIMLLVGCVGCIYVSCVGDYCLVCCLMVLWMRLGWCLLIVLNYVCSLGVVCVAIVVWLIVLFSLVWCILLCCWFIVVCVKMLVGRLRFAYYACLWVVYVLVVCLRDIDCCLVLIGLFIGVVDDGFCSWWLWLVTAFCLVVGLIWWLRLVVTRVMICVLVFLVCCCLVVVCLWVDYVWVLLYWLGCVFVEGLLWWLFIWCLVWVLCDLGLLGVCWLGIG